jgi:hypothetical protein
LFPPPFPPNNNSLNQGLGGVEFYGSGLSLESDVVGSSVVIEGADNEGRFVDLNGDGTCCAELTFGDDFVFEGFGNDARTWNGGVFYVQKGAKLTLGDNNRFLDSSSYLGGHIFMSSHSTAIAELVIGAHCEFSGGYANYGGAIYVDGADGPYSTMFIGPGTEFNDK